MAHITVVLPEQSIHIHAQRELAFEMVSAIGGSMPNGKSGSNSKPTILKEEESRMFVEFKTPMKLGPFSMTWKSREWVTPVKPESIDFEMVPGSGIVNGGLRQLSDRFEFEQQGNCTVLKYKSRFGIRWSVGGWILGKFLFAPMIKSHMNEHLHEVKEMVESRAVRSRIYPQLPCSEENN